MRVFTPHSFVTTGSCDDGGLSDRVPVRYRSPAHLKPVTKQCTRWLHTLAKACARLVMFFHFVSRTRPCRVRTPFCPITSDSPTSQPTTFRRSYIYKMSALSAPGDTGPAIPGTPVSQPDDMVASSTSARLTYDPSDALALVNAVTSSDHPNDAVHKHHPDQHWDGRRVTLSGWYAEFETTLSYLNAPLAPQSVRDL